MKKMLAIILAVLMLAGILLTAHAEEVEFNFPALEALTRKVKVNAQGSFGTSGDGESTFGPGKKCTRAQIATMLWRAAGSPEAEGENYFADVSESAYYAPAVAWAYENGITKGAGDGCFDPNAPCTRAQIVTMLWRANGSPEEEAPARFADVRKGAWYAPAVHWAAGNGVATGTGSGEFSPNVICTRAQVVTMLWKNGGEG